MSPVLRPIYQEGQILGAADLNAQLTYERLGAVWHERTEHLWGVAQGLALETIDRKTPDGKSKYVDVTLGAGRAVDRLGRSIVALDPIPLDPDAFRQQIAKPNNTDLYPVFVQAIEVPRSGETQPGKCAVALTTRIEETLQISFGSPGEELIVLDQTAATVDQGFGTPTLSDKVLVGWVKFNADPPLAGFAANKFNSVATESNGIRVRYVGVVASDVVAGGGELTLHTRPEGARFAVSIREDSTGGCRLKFGKQDGTSAIVPTFSVDEKGNICYAGTLTPAPIAKTLAESGVVFDGIKLPLPAGVTEDQVNQGAVRLHVQLTPLAQMPRTVVFSGGPKLAFPLVVRCGVDVTTDRIVHCQVRWYDPTAASFTAAGVHYIDAPGPCTYMVIATGK
jgi:hypothetical protein